jgi:hypothetical protein
VECLSTRCCPKEDSIQWDEQVESTFHELK